MKVIHRLVPSLCTALVFFIHSPAQALANVDSWAQDGVEAARGAGLEPAVLAGAEAAAPITRAEFAAVALEAYKAVTGQEPALDAPAAFPDCDDPAVTAALGLGLVKGRSDGTFAPGTTINRQELCVMLANTAKAAGKPAEAAGDLSQFPDAGTVDWWALEAVTAMTDYGIVSGVSTYGALSLDPFGTATRQQAMILSGRFVETFAQDDPEAAPWVPDDPEAQGEPPENGGAGTTPEPGIPVKDNTITGVFPITEEEKQLLVFGEVVEYFQTEAEAEAAMAEIEVPVWRLLESGEKKAGTAKLKVHAALGPVLQAVFQEIFNGEEQFPIKNIGGYAWRSSERSEHRWGTAVDLNWEENFEAEIGEDGELIATTGNYWKPGEDPYSIPEDGDVVRAFKKYGFSWGGDAWASKRDYMHFSYFGR